MKCVFAKGSCQTCGKSEGKGHALCFYNDSFWFPKSKKRIVFDASHCIIIPYRKGLKSSISKTDRGFIYDRDGYQCLSCGSFENLTIDHIIPLSNGGLNNRNNYQTLCEKCNSAKGSVIINYRNL